MNDRSFSGFDHSLDEFYMCPICFNNYDEYVYIPKLLPCQHSICSQCLPKLYKQITTHNYYIECPIDKLKHNIRVENVNKNRLILQLLEATKKHLFDNPQNIPSQNSIDRQTVHASSALNSHSPTASVSCDSLFYTDSNKSEAYRTTSATDSQQQYRYGYPVHDAQEWNYSNYLKKLFNDVDTNGNGHITVVELREALRRGQSSSYFDAKTVLLFIEKYDRNGDGEIDFFEFKDLFFFLNDEFEKFLIIDTDGNGTIDAYELANAMNQGYSNLKHEIFDYIVRAIESYRPNGITFDLFCRVMLRFNYLRKQYDKIPYYNKTPFDEYIRTTFFAQFW